MGFVMRQGLWPLRAVLMHYGRRQLRRLVAMLQKRQPRHEPGLLVLLVEEGA